MMTTTPNPTEAQIEEAARAFFREYHGEDIWPELRDDGELDTRSRALAATRAALTAAGVAPQPVVDEAALAKAIDGVLVGCSARLYITGKALAHGLVGNRAAWLREGVAPQEPSRLPDFFASKPMPNSYVPAPVLPSSICQHNMVSYTDSVSEKPENFCSLCGYQPSSGVDVETLANLIHSTSVAHFGGLDPRVAPIIARAVAAWLKRQGGESRDAVDKD